VSALPEDLQSVIDAIHAAAGRKLARDCVALDVRTLSSITDVLYICHGASARAVDAIVDEVLDALAAEGRRGHHVEGRAAQQWVLIDGGDVMIHVFVEEKRHHYDLERLWHDAPKVPLAA
jgi:ribosome-associated protein